MLRSTISVVCREFWVRKSILRRDDSHFVQINIYKYVSRDQTSVSLLLLNGTATCWYEWQRINFNKQIFEILTQGLKR